MKSDPVGDPLCQRPECLACTTSDKDRGRCRLSNLVYKTECKLCTRDGVKAQYWGETAGDAYLRSSEHSEDLLKLRGGHMEKHLRDKHPAVDIEDPQERKAENLFSFKVHKKYKNAMDRQLGEAIMIARNGGMESENILNSKDEFSRCLIPEIEMRKRYTRKKPDSKREREEPEVTGGEGADQRVRKKLKMGETQDTKANVTTRPQETHVKGKKKQAEDRPAKPSNTTQTETPTKVTPTPTKGSKETQEGDLSPQDPRGNSIRNTNKMQNKPNSTTTNNTNNTNTTVNEKHTYTNTTNTPKDTRGTPYKHMSLLGPTGHMSPPRPTGSSEVTNTAHEVLQMRQLSHETQEEVRSKETRKGTPTTKEKHDEETEVNKHETLEEPKTERKRKRNTHISNISDSDSDFDVNSGEISKHTETQTPSILNNVSHRKIDPKQSKIQSKPRFKSTRKANLRPIKANTIKNYFSNIGTRDISRARGGDRESEDESPIIGDLLDGVLTTDGVLNLCLSIIIFFSLVEIHAQPSKYWIQYWTEL